MATKNAKATKAPVMVAPGGRHAVGCEPVLGPWLHRIRGPVASLRPNSGYTLASLQDGWWDAPFSSAFANEATGLVGPIQQRSRWP